MKRQVVNDKKHFHKQPIDSKSEFKRENIKRVDLFNKTLMKCLMHLYWVEMVAFEKF